MIRFVLSLAKIAGSRGANGPTDTTSLLPARGIFLSACLCLAWAASAVAQSSVTLAWNPVTNSIAGYRLYRGGVSRSYTNNVNTGTATQSTISNLAAGATYFFAVTAFTGAGAESDYSTELQYTVPGNTNSGSPVIILTSPSSGAVYTEPSSINLSASVTPNGHQIARVQFFSGPTLLGERTNSPYTYTWNNVLAGNYSVKARLLYDAAASLDSPAAAVTVTSSRPPPPPPTNLPAPWLTADIGSPGAAGNATYNNGVYTVSGAGNISGTNDNFRFIYQALTGDGDIRVRVNSAQNTGTNGFVGVVMRETLAANSKCMMTGISPTGATRAQWRDSTGNTTQSSRSTTLSPPNAWLRLQRTGNKLRFYTSTDGVNWTQISQQQISMAINGYLGLAVASGSSGTLNTSTFSNVTVVP